MLCCAMLCSETTWLRSPDYLRQSLQDKSGRRRTASLPIHTTSFEVWRSLALVLVSTAVHELWISINVRSSHLTAATIVGDLDYRCVPAYPECHALGRANASPAAAGGCALRSDADLLSVQRIHSSAASACLIDTRRIRQRPVKKRTTETALRRQVLSSAESREWRGCYIHRTGLDDRSGLQRPGD